MKINVVDNRWLDSHLNGANFPATVDAWSESHNKNIEWCTILSDKGALLSIFGIDIDMDFTDNELGDLCSFEISQDLDLDMETLDKVFDSIKRFLVSKLNQKFDINIDADTIQHFN